MRSTWGTSLGEDKPGARSRIHNTKVARRARARQTFPPCLSLTALSQRCCRAASVELQFSAPVFWSRNVPPLPPLDISPKPPLPPPYAPAGQHLKDIPLADSCEYPKVERAAKLVALKVLQALPSPAGAPPAAPPPLGLVHYPPARYGTPPWYPAVHALVRETLLRNAPALAPDCPLLGFDAFKRALCVWHLNPLRTAQPPRGLPWGRYLRGLRDRDARAGAPDLQAAFGAAWRELGRAPDPEALCCEGQGLYLWHNACNHSCVPSARDRLVRAEGGRLRLQVTALRRLKAGDEVVVAYVGRDLSYAERQARLRYYGFCCVCPKCETERQGLGLPAPVHPEFTCEHDF